MSNRETGILLLTCACLLASAQAGIAAQVTVKAIGPDSAYIAIVAEDRPWSDPAQESIGSGASWEVPAGSYRIVAGARGYATEFSEPIAIAQSDTRELRFPLTSLATVKGFVVSEGGNPVARASVTSGFQRNVLSAIAEAHLRSNSVAISSTNGSFAVFVRPETQRLIIEAAEYAPAVMDVALLAGKPSTTVVLRKGASLGLRWSAPIEPRSEKISLLPVDAALPAQMTRAEAIALWTRSITQSEPRWDGLPSGTYQIVMRSAGASSAPPPVDLGEVILAPGEQRSVNVVLPARPANQDASAGTFRVLVRDAELENENLHITHWSGSNRTKLIPSIRRVAGGSLLTLDAPCSAGSVLVLDTLGEIGSTTLDGTCGETIRVALAPRARLAARITVPSGVRLPRFALLRATNCGAGGEMELPFAIADSRVSMTVPSNCSGFSVHASGFAPVTLPARLADVRTIALREGAAAALRIRSAATADLMAGVRITAIRVHDLPAIRKDADLESMALITAVSDASGWARMDGLPDEHVVFFLRAAGRRHAQVSEPYKLTPGTETVIDDLLLQPASNVHVTVSRPEALADSLDLSAIELRPAGHNHWPRFLAITGAITPSGTVIEDVPPGSWEVQATGRLRNGFAIRAAKTTVDVVSGADQHVTLAIRDGLYQGRVTRAGAPVAGTINLKPADRRSGRRHSVATIAADGTFLVLLEDAGEYTARVQESSGGVSLNHYVAFTDPEKEVAIELPMRRITGRVVDSTGAPVSDAMVSATQQIADPGGEASARNTSDGRFVLRSVATGTWAIVASTKSGQSEPAVVSVDVSDVDDVTLLLEPIQIVKVRLTDITGAPVREAFVFAEFPQPGSLKSKSDVRSTGPDGAAEFRLSAAQQTSPANLVFATFDVRISCALRRLDADQSITLAPSFGELRLIGREWEKMRGVQSWLLSSNGCAVPFLGTSRERDITGETAIVFPRLASGTWSYLEIRTPEELAFVLTGRARTLNAIRTFTVESGKVTRVALPREQ